MNVFLNIFWCSVAMGYMLFLLKIEIRQCDIERQW